LAIDAKVGVAAAGGGGELDRGSIGADEKFGIIDEPKESAPEFGM